MAFLHPGDLSISQWLFLLLFWGGLFLGMVVVFALIIKYLVKRRYRQQSEER